MDGSDKTAVRRLYLWEKCTILLTYTLYIQSLTGEFGLTLQWSSVLLFTNALWPNPDLYQGVQYSVCVCAFLVHTSSLSPHTKKEKNTNLQTPLWLELNQAPPCLEVTVLSATQRQQSLWFIVAVIFYSELVAIHCAFINAKFSAVANCRRFTEGTAEEAKDILMPGVQKLFDKEDDKKGHLIFFPLFFNCSSAWISVCRRHCSYLLLQHVVHTAFSGAQPLRKCHFTLCHQCQRDDSPLWLALRHCGKLKDC